MIEQCNCDQCDYNGLCIRYTTPLFGMVYYLCPACLRHEQRRENYHESRERGTPHHGEES
jgi:hypothetical protein